MLVAPGNVFVVAQDGGHDARYHGYGDHDDGE
jgi:hypothetical protein